MMDIRHFCQCFVMVFATPCVIQQPVLRLCQNICLQLQNQRLLGRTWCVPCDLWRLSRYLFCFECAVYFAVLVLYLPSNILRVLWTSVIFDKICQGCLPCLINLLCYLCYIYTVLHYMCLSVYCVHQTFLFLCQNLLWCDAIVLLGHP